MGIISVNGLEVKHERIDQTDRSLLKPMNVALLQSKKEFAACISPLEQRLYIEFIQNGVKSYI